MQKNSRKKWKGPNGKTESIFKKQNNIGIKKKGPCFVCGKIGHVASDCKFRKGQDHHSPKPQANLTESEVIAAVVSEVSLVNNKIEWLVDTGATWHICSNKEMFLDYEEVIDGESVYLGDDGTTSVARKGKVLLKFTFGKSLALHSVPHVPNMQRNLVSGSLLKKAGIKLVFEADKLVLSRNGDFVGKGYCHGGLFVLYASFDNNNNTFIAYFVVSLIWGMQNYAMRMLHQQKE